MKRITIKRFLTSGIMFMVFLIMNFTAMAQWPTATNPATATAGTYTLSASSTPSNVPLGVNTFTVQCFGGGGGGGNAPGQSCSWAMGGGGGGGAFSTATVSLTYNTTMGVTVGAGGGAGANGSASVVTNNGSTVCSADFGRAGGAGSAGVDGAGGAGGAVANNIPVNAGFKGGNGGTGSSYNSSGGGGGSAGTTGAGGNGGAVTAGAAGAGGGFAGGVGKSSGGSDGSATGANGAGIGAGGGGETYSASGCGSGSTGSGGSGIGGKVVISYVVTPAMVSPSSSLAFGTVCQTLSSTAGANSFTIQSIALSSSLTVNALAGFAYCATSNGTYTSTLTLSPGAALTTSTVYVQFTPTLIQSYSGNINISGGGATAINVAETATGIGGFPTTPTAIGTSGDPTCSALLPATTYSSTSTNYSGFNWSLSDNTAGSINSSGVMTWNSGYFGTVNIQVYAIGCAGNSSTVTRPVTITQTPSVTVVSGGTTQCNGSVNISATTSGVGSIYYQGTTSGGTSTGLGTTPQTISGATNTNYYFNSLNGTCWGTQGSTFVGISSGVPGVATVPVPATNATGQAITATALSWTAASGATSYKVYFGTNSSPAVLQTTVTASTWTTPALNNSTQYYWRVDAVNYCGTTTGTVWNFTTANTTISATGITTWTRPTNVGAITVELWGGGGAGGGALTANPAAGGGGAGGGYVKAVNFAVSAASYTVSVGTAGTGVATVAVGGVGNPSFFGNAATILAVGGAGGTGGNVTASPGAGGAAVATGNVGFTSPFSYYGGGGSAGTASSAGGGGGGSSAGTGSNGTTVTASSTAGAAVAGGGIGGAGATTNAAGAAPASGVGGGGGGAKRTSGSNKGGNGAPGQAILSNFIYTPSITTQPSTAGQTLCTSAGSVTPLTVAADGTALTYQWFSNTSASTSGATNLGSGSGAQTSSYTPVSAVGPLYYYCVINSTPVTTAVTSGFSGAYNISDPPTFSSQSTAAQTKCQGDATTQMSVNYTGTGLTYQWYNNGNVSSPLSGSPVSLATASTFSPPTTLANVGSHYYYCVISGLSGCAAATSTVSGLVVINGLPSGSLTSSKSPICSGLNTSIQLSSSPASYKWSASGTGITFPVTYPATGAAGVDSVSEMLINTSSTVAATATYTVTPVSSAGCLGTTFTTSVTVNAQPVLNALTSPTICSGGTASIPLSGTQQSTVTYGWNASVTGGSASGYSSQTGQSSPLAQTITNTGAIGSSAATVLYSVKSTVTATGCISNPQTATVTVRPVPYGSASPASNTICSGDNTGITLSPTYLTNTDAQNSGYRWTTSLSSPAVTGPSISSTTSSGATGTAINTAVTSSDHTADETVTYTVWPVDSYTVGTVTTTCGSASANSTPFTVNLTVHPTPTGTASPGGNILGDYIIPNGTATGESFTTTPSSGCTFNWTITDNSSGAITGFDPSLVVTGAGYSIPDVLTNSDASNPYDVLYTITPVSSIGCYDKTGSSDFTADVTVEPTLSVT